ncbi:MAG: TIGR03761 family integrating conjugative element protein [Betaproteobacteria bacterium]|nr:TIGR03761 family integrating conjugative element protein [Betaproteobacteria bacterium]
MTANLSSAQIVRGDEGAINARIIAQVTKVDYRRIESASVKMEARFSSADGKRVFMRNFSSLQLHQYFISVVARTRLEAAEVEQVEGAIRDRLNAAYQAMSEAIDGAEALFKANGITAAATYDTQPLVIEVGVISSFARRYLETIALFDQLMPLLQTLEIYEVITSQAVDTQRALLKRKMREVVNAARYLALGLRKRMNVLAQEETAPTQSSESGETEENMDAQSETVTVTGECEESGGEFNIAVEDRESANEESAPNGPV